MMLKLLILTLCAVLPLILVKNAYAYIDPGTGSMIIQAVIAAIAVASVSIGIFWRRLRAFFERLFGRNGSGGDDSDAN
ncbi:MAG: hypothetical protein H8D67_13640 [Deltaproteobacteria bacterium]|nr:hypothetical protein [Deltaproteobacteria bacterium]